jgi:hypothetical protein
MNPATKASAAKAECADPVRLISKPEVLDRVGLLSPLSGNACVLERFRAAAISAAEPCGSNFDHWIPSRPARRLKGDKAV